MGIPGKTVNKQELLMKSEKDDVTSGRISG